MRTLVALLILSLPVLGIADSARQDPNFDKAMSLSSDQDQLARDINRYIEQFQAEPAKAPKLKSDKEEILAGFDQQKRGDPGAKIASRIAALPNESWLRRNLTRQLSLARRMSASDNQTYNDFLARLMIDYYTHPERRDAIAALIGKLDAEVEPQIKGRDPNLFANAVSKGTFYAQLVLCLVDWRQSQEGGIARDISRIYESGSSLWSRVVEKISSGEFFAKAAREEELTAQAAQQRQASEFARSFWEAGKRAAVESTKTLGRSVKDLPKTAARSAAELGQTVGDLLDNKAEIPGKIKGAITLKNLKKVSKVLYKASRGLILGTAYGAYEWNRQSDLIKVSPKEALKFIQTYAVADLEAHTIDELADFEQKFPLDTKIDDVKQLIACASEDFKKTLEGYEADVAAGARQLAHFQKSAPQFQSRIRLTGLEPESYEAKENPEWRSDVASLRSFVLSSKELTDKLRETRQHLENIRKQRSMENDEVRVGFEGILDNLQKMEAMTLVFETALQQFDQLSPTERGSMIQGCTPKQP